MLDWINPFNKVADIVSEAVEDKDKANQINAEIEKGRQDLIKQAEIVYMAELDTKTVPWVDALHKMSRNIGSWLGYALAFYMVHQGYEPWATMAAIAPGGIYNYVKGKGK